MSVKRYTTLAGHTLELSRELIKSYIYCNGCRMGWHVKKQDGEREASHHAASCRRNGSR